MDNEIDQTDTSLQQNASPEVVAQAEMQNVVPNGRLMTEDELAKIAIANKRRGQEMAQKEYEAKLRELQVQQPDHNVEDIVNQKINEILQQQEAERQRQLEEQQQNQFFMEVAPKIEKAKSKYEDFDKVIQDNGVSNNPALVQYANTVPNAGDVIYELAKNPTKYATFAALSSNPATQQAALNYVNELSKSIDANEQAQQTRLPNSPLSNIQSTPVNNGGKKAGSGDWKNYWRGKL